MSLLEIRGASFAYGRTAALEDVSFSAGEGEFVGLVGPNGAGKSTLVRLAAGLVTPDGGTVRLAGLDPHAAPRARWRACARSYPRSRGWPGPSPSATP